MNAKRRIILPAALVALGVYLLAGCIYIPTFNSVTKGKNYAKEVGDAASRKSIRVGRTHRDDVMRLLGPPPFVTPDGSGAAYPWTTLRGIWVMPLCFAAQGLHGYHALYLTFDERGYVTRFELDHEFDDLFSADPHDMAEGFQPWGLWRWPDEPGSTVPRQPEK